MILFFRGCNRGSHALRVAGDLFRVVAHEDRPGSLVGLEKGVADLRGSAVVKSSAELAATDKRQKHGYSRGIGTCSWSFL